MNAPAFGRGRGWLMALLVIGYTLNFIDRQIAGILAEPINCCWSAATCFEMPEVDRPASRIIRCTALKR